MIAVRFFSSEEFSAKLSRYACMKVADVSPRVELWKTGWGEAFTVFIEPDGRIDQWQHERVVTEVVAKTMPNGWEKSAG